MPCELSPVVDAVLEPGRMHNRSDRKKAAAAQGEQGDRGSTVERCREALAQATRWHLILAFAGVLNSYSDYAYQQVTCGVGDTWTFMEYNNEQCTGDGVRTYTHNAHARTHPKCSRRRHA